MSNISIVIGSWGSYNECNERALGSKWLDLEDFTVLCRPRQQARRASFTICKQSMATIRKQKIKQIAI